MKHEQFIHNKRTIEAIKRNALPFKYWESNPRHFAKAIMRAVGTGKLEVINTPWDKIK